MHTIFEEHGKIILTIIIAIVIISTLFGAFFNYWRDRTDTIEGGTMVANLDYATMTSQKPVLNVSDTDIVKDTTFNVLSNVIATDTIDGDLKDKVTIKEITGNRLNKVSNHYTFNTSERGFSLLEYQVENSLGHKVKKCAYIFID